MKLLLPLLLACAAIAPAAERPGGFLGIKWGASPEEALRIFQQRPGIVVSPEADDYRIELTGGSFAGLPEEKWIIEFPDRKFASATVLLKDNGNASSTYKEFKTQLTSKYGSATIDRKSAGGGQSSKPAVTMAIWRFRPNMSDRTSVVISAELSGNGRKGEGEQAQGGVVIKYVNETLAGIDSSGGGTAAKPAVPAVKKDDL